jgi:hypothetical protein
MTSGDEPQIGGQPSDDAPMISRRNGRNVALARAAYLAGDLRDLLDVPNDHQMFVFKQANLREVLNSERPAIDQAIALDPLFANLMDELDRWFSNPSTAQEIIVKTFTDHYLSIDSGEDIERLTTLIRVGIWGSYDEMWEVFLNERGWYATVHRWMTERDITHWQLEALWAILTDQPLPPLRDPDVGR